MPTLRKLNAVGAVAAIVLAAWLWFAPDGHAALQPGHLADAHAALFSDDPPSDPHLASAVEIAQELGCAACHESYGRPSLARCAACHEDIVDEATAKRAHPFEAGDSLACGRCHREHHGGTPPSGTLFPHDIQQRCSDCHGDDYQDPTSLLEGLARAQDDHDLAPTATAPVPRSPSVGFEAFDHGQHHAITECAACHVPIEATTGADFTRLTFESCMDCHAPDAQASADRPAEWLPPTESRWRVDWHGSGDEGQHCRTCHAEPFAAPLRMAEQLPPRAALFDVVLRTHRHEFETTAGPGECVSCHKSGRTLSATQVRSGRPFRHEQHLSALWPDSDEQRALVEGQCTECHGDIAASQGLTLAPDAYVGPALESCAECHHDEGRPLVTTPGVVADAGAPVLVPDFPHDVHVDVEGGCFACHEFDADRPGLVETPAAVAKCVHCHVREEGGVNVAHAFLAGGGDDSCGACHAPRGAASPDAPMASVFYAESNRTRPPSSFPHALEAHQRATCTECHGELAEGRDVHSPPESAATCRECHAAQRFHWR